MLIGTSRRAILTLILCSLFLTNGLALIMVGGTDPVTNRDWPARSEKVANLPSRFSFWEGPPDGGGNYHFEYAGDTPKFQSTLDTFATIKASRLELLVYDGGTTSTFSKRPVHWEFEIWSRESFYKLNHPPNSIFGSNSPWFRRPLPPPRLSVFLGAGNPVDWAAVHVPQNVTLLDRRMATSPRASSAGGVVRATIHDMATSKTLSGAILEIGHYKDRLFQADASTKANANGVALLRDLPAGNYIVRLRCEGYATRQVGQYKNYGRTLGIFDLVCLAPAAALRGRVADTDGHPVESVTIGVMGLVGLDGMGYQQNLYNEQSKVQTDAAGRFTLESLPQGRISLRVTKTGYHYFSFDTFPIPGGEVRIVMTKSGVIHGKVLGAGQLPEGQKVYVKLEPVGNPLGRWGGDKPCEPDGSFTFDGIPADTYTLVPYLTRPQNGGYTIVTPPASQPSRQFNLQAGQSLEMNLTLKPKP